MTLFSLLQEARMAAKLLEKKFGIKDVSRREEYKHILDQINQSIIYQGGTLDKTYCYWTTIILIKSTFKVALWMKSTDTDNDGKLSYKEFNRSLKEFLKITADDNDDEEK